MFGIARSFPRCLFNAVSDYVKHHPEVFKAYRKRRHDDEDIAKRPDETIELGKKRRKDALKKAT
jgi:hypothetical protein